MSVDTDNNGNLFVTGFLSNTTNFPAQNPLGGAYFQGANNGTDDVFILKFTNSGVLLWSTYYGGSDQDNGQFITTDGAGNVVVTGSTNSTNLPVLNPGGGAYFQGTNAGLIDDAFILKFNNSGVLIWATYYGGGSWADYATTITTDASGNLFVTGMTASTNFPVLNPFGGAYFQGTNAGNYDIFILKFSSSGLLLWSTYYGGSGQERGHSISIDINGNVFVTGFTQSPNFPILNPFGGVYFQGSISGTLNAFILKFTNTGVLLWATYFGGNGMDYGQAITIDGVGNVFVTGFTNSMNFPVLNPGGGAYFQGTNAGNYDIFILKFSNAGILLWSTYYGGSSDDMQGGYDVITIDSCENVYMSFFTGSTTLPFKGSCDGGYFDNTYNGGIADVFIVLFSNPGIQRWSSYIGGDGRDFREALAVDANNNIFLAGQWSGTTINNSTYPLTNPGGGAYYDPTFNGNYDGYIVKFTPATIVATTSITQPNCSSPCSGFATVNVSGTCSFNYSWSNGQTTQTATGLCAGVYSVSVTNEFCLDTVLVVNITTPLGSVTPTFAVVAPYCSGKAIPALPTTSNNSITGTWSPSINNSTTTLYTFTPAGGQCAATTSLTITVHPLPTLTTTSANPSCAGNTGTATASPSGGASPYNYSWNTTPIQTTQTANGLVQGTYTVTITDGKGCTAMSSVSIVTPSPLTGQFTKGTASCIHCGCKEWIMISATGGTKPYSYLWPDGYVYKYKDELCTGNYNINIKDKNGCSVNVLVSAP